LTDRQRTDEIIVTYCNNKTQMMIIATVGWLCGFWDIQYRSW